MGFFFLPSKGRDSPGRPTRVVPRLLPPSVPIGPRSSRNSSSSSSSNNNSSSGGGVVLVLEEVRLSTEEVQAPLASIMLGLRGRCRLTADARGLRWCTSVCWEWRIGVQCVWASSCRQKGRIVLVRRNASWTDQTQKSFLLTAKSCVSCVGKRAAPLHPAAPAMYPSLAGSLP